MKNFRTPILVHHVVSIDTPVGDPFMSDEKKRLFLARAYAALDRLAAEFSSGDLSGGIHKMTSDGASIPRSIPRSAPTAVGRPGRTAQDSETLRTNETTLNHAYLISEAPPPPPPPCHTPSSHSGDYGASGESGSSSSSCSSCDSSSSSSDSGSSSSD